MEPQIEINGTKLSEGQTMALRVACTSFLEEMARDADALGTDAHGRRMTSAYVDRLREVLKLMFA